MSAYQQWECVVKPTLTRLESLRVLKPDDGFVA